MIYRSTSIFSTLFSAEPLQVALDNSALCALVPVANKKQVVLLPEEVVEKLDIAFYGDLHRAVMKGLLG